MDSKLIFIIVLSCLEVILIITALVCSSIHKKRVSIVLQNSKLIRLIQILNNFYKTKFIFNIQTEHAKFMDCDIKYRYDKTSVYNCFYIYVKEEYLYFKGVAEKLDNNNKIFREYQEKYKKLNSSITEAECKLLKIPFKSFIKIEKKFYNKNFLIPKLDTSIYCEISYTSPAGRNHYSKNDTYNLEDLKHILQKIKLDEDEKKSYEYKKKIERLLLTDSLRYDVMRRDGFKCVLCGATAQEGAKLHVDHIIPISKGGRTELSNLRTLCDRCNLGKRDKIESQNLNSV